jgi:hypothetical protein
MKEDHSIIELPPILIEETRRERKNWKRVCWGIEEYSSLVQRITKIFLTKKHFYARN